MAKIVIDREKCKGCELCIHFCKKNCIQMDDNFNHKGYRTSKFEDNGECTGCMQCATVCPDIAIEVWR